MTENTSETPEQKRARFEKELKEIKEQKDAETIKKDERPDIVLECRINSKGQIMWSIPTDLRMASYMLATLDTMIKADIGTRIGESMAKKNNIKNKIMGIFK